MSSHTPGPWVVLTGLYGVSVVADDPECAVICDVGRPHDAQDQANAGLIAAAPDLLAALVELRYACTDKAERMADAAIAKATGSAP